MNSKKEQTEIKKEKNPKPQKPSDKPVNIELTEGSDRYPDVFIEYFPQEINFYEKLENNTFLFRCKNDIQLQVEIYSTRIFRHRYSLKREFPEDFSYAIDKSFKKQEVEVTFEVFNDHFEISTEKLICSIAKANLAVTYKNKSGEIISVEDQGFYARSTLLKGLETIQISKTAQEDESYFGLGDKSGRLNLKGQKLENWNTDAFAFGADSDPLYKSIPFYFGLHQDKGYGIFLDNTFRTHFDFDSNKNGQVSFSAQGGEMNYYFIYGPNLNDVAIQYTDITGKPDMPPIWALGFHQCRWSYYPESRVKEVAKEFRERKIPCDAIYLDIDYMDDYKCFTWNKEYFPNPTQMVRELREIGFKTIVMIDPGLKIDDTYKVYLEGKEKGFYCKRPDGETMEGPVWPPNCAFPDFTVPNVRSWWGHQYAALYSKNRVAGFWNDMNEPALFKVNHKTFPDNILHHYDGHPCSHAKAHNIYGFNMSRATHEGLIHLKGHRRPFVITRATYAGGQRYSSVWTGDNVASWEHLQIANRQCQRLSISGFSFVGSDIGGFVDVPDGELFVRWIQLGIFHPLYRVHSMGNNADGSAEVEANAIKEKEKENRLDQEPWSFGAPHTDLARYAIELRYQLLPYLYTTFKKYVDLGQPMLRSLIFEDQNDSNLIDSENEFLFGDHLIVSPVTKEKAITQDIYLPKGKWYNYWTAKVHEGRQTITVPAPIHQIPIMVREGAVIPHYPIMQYTEEKPVAELMLHVFYKNGFCDSQLYEDAGDGFDYKDDQYSSKEFHLKGSETTLTLLQKKDGNYFDTYLHVNVFIYGLPFEPSKCQVDDEPISFDRAERAGNPVFQLTCSNLFSKIVLEK